MNTDESISTSENIPANTRRWPNVGSVLDQRQVQVFDYIKYHFLCDEFISKQ